MYNNINNMYNHFIIIYVQLYDKNQSKSSRSELQTILDCKFWKLPTRGWMMMNVAARCCCWAAINTCWMPPWSAVGCHPANIGSKSVQMVQSPRDWSIMKYWIVARELDLCWCHGNGSSSKEKHVTNMCRAARISQIYPNMNRCDKMW